MLDQLLQQAINAQQRAYAPYSFFHVGCCIRTTNNILFTGCNVENASYGLTTCAEACAVGQMIMGDDQHLIQEIVIVGPNDDELCPPCGACRQRLWEFHQADTMVHLANSQGIQKSLLLTDLMPYAFGAELLKV